MKRQSQGVVLLALLVLAASSCARREPQPAPVAAPTAESLRLKETTVRNVTGQPIGYRIYPAGKPEAAESREIAPGTVDRFRTASALEIEFSTGRKDAVYSLDPGSPYSFRVDDETTIDLFLGSHGRDDAVDLAPWVPTPQPVVDRMLELAAVTSRDVLYDIGCGDGRIVITAARRYGARGVGIDIDKAMIEESERNAKAAGVERQVKFLGMDATKADISGGDGRQPLPSPGIERPDAAHPGRSAAAEEPRRLPQLRHPRLGIETGDDRNGQGRERGQALHLSLRPLTAPPATGPAEKKRRSRRAEAPVRPFEPSIRPRRRCRGSPTRRRS